MNPFHTIAIPHPDILAHRLSLDTFAADLWDVYQGQSAKAYATADTFFQQTYMTETLTQLFAILESRLRGDGGEPIFSLQAASGHGKTHALIAAYHQAARWNARPIVIVGTALQATDTLWGALEEQLTGTRQLFLDNVAPGRNALRRLLAKQGSLLILIDELLAYITKAATIQIGESTLAAQTFVFLQELSEALGSLNQQAIIVALPSGAFERYDQQSEWFFGQVQKIFGARGKVLMPIQEDDIPQIVRKRLYPQIDEEALQDALNEFMEYAVRESLIPPGIAPEFYRNQMHASYPFIPEVFSILGRRWSSFAGFHGICGILRILSLVLDHCQRRPLPYLTLADIDLTNHNIRRELLRHVGGQFEQIIFTEWTAENATIPHAEAMFAHEASPAIPIAERAATAIFLCSFSDSGDIGASAGEIKRHALLPPLSSHLIPDVLHALQAHLYFLHIQQNSYHFSLQPNLNFLLLKSMEHVTDRAVEEFERDALRKTLPGKIFEVVRLTHVSDEIPDLPTLQLVVLNTHDETFIRRAIKTKGNIPRVNQNTLLFLTPDDEQQNTLTQVLTQYLAWGMLLTETEETISEEQKKFVKLRWKTMEHDVEVAIRQRYCRLVVPKKEGIATHDVGQLRSETHTTFEEDLYALLVSSGEVIEELPSVLIQEHCLKNKPFMFTEQLFRTSTTMLGEPRIANRAVCENAVKQGVFEGTFGLGVLHGKQLICSAFKQDVFYMNFFEDEVIIRADLCASPEDSSSQPSALRIAQPIMRSPEDKTPMASRTSVHLRIPFSKKHSTAFMGMLYALQQHFEDVEIELHAKNGQISEPTYQQQIEEILQRMRR